MEIILIESVAGLGRPGDRVKVKSGYARNFLMPRGKAVPVSSDVLRNLTKLKQRADEEERALISSMGELKAKLKGARFELSARATDEGHLFGSVTERDVQAAIEAEGWQIPARSVRMEQHIKEAGDHELMVHLYGEIEATVVVEVIPIDDEGNPIELVDEQAAAAADEGDGDESAEDASETEAEEATAS